MPNDFASIMLNAFTVDVEDYFQVTGFERDVPRTRWDEFPSRVVDSTRRILRLLAQRDVKGTFFVLGWVARRFPELVREIDEAGHEVGSHSFWHRLIYTQTAEEFRTDLRLSKKVLEDCIGKPVRAFRAPSFSITRKSLWALEVLVQEGFAIDSSVFPTQHDRYGIPGANKRIHKLETAAGPITEFPPSIVGFGRLRLPVGGGGYFRLYPYSCSRLLLHRINRVERRPFMFYIHPWEVDPDQPRLSAGTRGSRFRHYVNLSKTTQRLERLLGDFQFAPMCDVLPASFTSTAAVLA